MSKTSKPVRRGDDRPVPWKDGRLPAATCAALKRNGDPCKRPPIQGANVCGAHGGAAPQVRRRAQQRILEASDRAAARLEAIMDDTTAPTAVQLAAARDLLDRADVVGKQQLDVAVHVSKWDVLLDELVIEVDVEEDDDNFDANVVDAEIVYDADEEASADEAHDAAMEARQAARDRAKRRTGSSVPASASRAETDDPGEGVLNPPQPSRPARTPRPQAGRRRRYPGLS